MTVSQAKTDLAVIYKLHQHAEHGGGAITPEDVTHLFELDVPLRRVELALDELRTRGDVERKYHPHYSEEGLWEITRAGIDRVDRALKVPTSFIARLHANGDGWLETEEAEKAILKKVAPTVVQPSGPMAPLILPTRRPVESKPDWGKSGAVAGWVGVVVAIIAILITIWLAQK